MAGLERKQLSNPDETRTFNNGRIDVVNIGGVDVLDPELPTRPGDCGDDLGRTASPISRKQRPT